MDTSPRPPERTQPRLGGFRPVKIGASATSGVTRPAGVPRPASAPVRPQRDPRDGNGNGEMARPNVPEAPRPTGAVPPALPAVSGSVPAPMASAQAPVIVPPSALVISQPIVFTQAKPPPPSPRQSQPGRLDLETSSALASRAGSTTVLLSTAMSQELMAQAAEMLSAEQRRPKGIAGSIQNRRQAMKTEQSAPVAAAGDTSDTTPPSAGAAPTQASGFPQPLTGQTQNPLFPPLPHSPSRLGRPAFRRGTAASLPASITRAFVPPAGPNGTVPLPRDIAAGTGPHVHAQESSLAAPASTAIPSATATINLESGGSGAISAKVFPALPNVSNKHFAAQTIAVKSMRDMSHALDTAAAISEVLATASGSGSAAATDALRRMEAESKSAAPAPKAPRVLPPTFIIPAPILQPEAISNDKTVEEKETAEAEATKIADALVLNEQQQPAGDLAEQVDAMPLPIPVFPPEPMEVERAAHHEILTFTPVDLLPPAPAPTRTFPDFSAAPSPAPLRLSGLKQSTPRSPLPGAVPGRSGSHAPFSASLRPTAKAPARPASAKRASIFDPRPEDEEVPIPPFQPHRVKGLSGNIGTVRPVQKFGLSMLFVSMAGAMEDLTLGVVRRKTASLAGLKLTKNKPGDKAKENASSTDNDKAGEKKANAKSRTSRDMDLLTRRGDTTPTGAHRGLRPHDASTSSDPAEDADAGVLNSAPQFASMASTEEFDAMSIIGPVAATGVSTHSLSLSNSTSTAAIALQSKGLDMMDMLDKAGATSDEAAGQSDSKAAMAANRTPAPIHPAHLLMSGLALAGAALVLKMYLYELTGSMAMWMDAAFTVMLATSIGTSLLVWTRRDIEPPMAAQAAMALHSSNMMPRSEIYYIEEPDITLPERGYVQYPVHAAAVALMMVTCIGACIAGLAGANFTLFARLHDMTQTFPATAALVSAGALIVAQLVWWGYCRSMATTHSSYRAVLECAWLQVHSSIAAALGVACLTRAESYADTALSLFVLVLMLRAAWLLFARQVKIAEELC